MELQIDGNYYEVLDMNAKLASKGKWGAKDSLVSLSKADTLAKCDDDTDYRGVVSVTSHASGKFGVRIRVGGQPSMGYVGISRLVASNPNYWTVDSANAYTLAGASADLCLYHGHGVFR